MDGLSSAEAALQTVHRDLSRFHAIPHHRVLAVVLVIFAL